MSNKLISDWAPQHKLDIGRCFVGGLTSVAMQKQLSVAYPSMSVEYSYNTGRLFAEIITTFLQYLL